MSATVDGINYTLTLGSPNTASVAHSPEATGVIVIPDSISDGVNNYAVTSIEQMAFFGNALITSVTFPASVPSTGSIAFQGCTNLETITLPIITSPEEGIFYAIDSASFRNCSKLNNISIPSNVTNFSPYGFQNCTSLTNITISNGVSSIGQEFFKGCTSLINITIPNSVTTIGDEVFMDCTSLATVFFNETETLPTIGTDSFFNIAPNNTAYYLDGVSGPGDSDPATYLRAEGFANARGPIICFKEDSTILCSIDGKEIYVPIQNIRNGTLVKTVLSGLVPVAMIGTSKVYNPANSLRGKSRLYRCPKETFPELSEDLIITGCHSILVDSLTEEQREEIIELAGCIFVTDKKYRLMACVDERAVPYEEEGTFNIWHLALEHEDERMNYGVFANGGLLVETTSKRMLSQYSGMDLM